MNEEYEIKAYVDGVEHKVESAQQMEDGSWIITAGVPKGMVSDE